MSTRAGEGGPERRPRGRRVQLMLRKLWAIFLGLKNEIKSFPGGANGKKPAFPGKRHRFDPWIRKIPCRKAWQPTPVFLPGESHGQRSLMGYSPKCCRVGHDWSNLALTHGENVKPTRIFCQRTATTWGSFQNNKSEMTRTELGFHCRHSGS